MSGQDPMAPSDKLAIGLEMQKQFFSEETFNKSRASRRDDLPSRISAEFVADVCFSGYARPGLTFRERSLMNLAMLTALNRGPELRIHIRAARYNGWTEEQIVEACRHAMIYCGVPAGRTALAIASDVFAEWNAEKEAK